MGLVSRLNRDTSLGQQPQSAVITHLLVASRPRPRPLRAARAPQGCFAKDAGLEHLWVITSKMRRPPPRSYFGIARSAQ